MGKGLIQSSLGGGQYAVKIFFDNARIEVKKTKISETILELDQKLIELEPVKLAHLTNLQNAQQIIYQLINQYPIDEKQLLNVQKQTFEIQADYEVIIRKLSQIKLHKKSLQDEITFLDKYCPSEIETTAWCVSRNEGLSGECETIEVDLCVKKNRGTGETEYETGFWINATQEQTSLPAPTSILQHPMATSVHANWLNLCLLPAVQKQIPRYRIATLDSVNQEASTCSLTFDGVFEPSYSSNSLISSLPIIPAQSTDKHLHNVPIYYPPCHAKPFDAGDRVIVSLAYYVKVIGFVSNPKRCRKVVHSSGFAAWAFSLPSIITNEGIVSNYSKESEYRLIYHILERPESAPELVPDGSTLTENATETNIGLTTTLEVISGKTHFIYEYTFSSELTLDAGSVGSVEYGSGNAIWTSTGYREEKLRQKLIVYLSINGSNVGNVYEAEFNDVYRWDQSYITGQTQNTNSGTHNRSFNARIRKVYVYDDEDIIKGEVIVVSSGSRHSVWQNAASTSVDSATSDVSETVTSTYKSGDMADIEIDEGTRIDDLFVATAFSGLGFMQAPDENDYVLGHLTYEKKSWSGGRYIMNEV